LSTQDVEVFCQHHCDSNLEHVPPSDIKTVVQATEAMEWNGFSSNQEVSVPSPSQHHSPPPLSALPQLGLSSNTQVPVEANGWEEASTCSATQEQSPNPTPRARLPRHCLEKSQQVLLSQRQPTPQQPPTRPNVPPPRQALNSQHLTPQPFPFSYSNPPRVLARKPRANAKSATARTPTTGNILLHLESHLNSSSPFTRI